MSRLTKTLLIFAAILLHKGSEVVSIDASATMIHGQGRSA